jgi:hypothetical protein
MHMKFAALPTITAIGLVLGIPAAYAQKADQGKAAPQAQQSDTSKSQSQGAEKQGGAAGKDSARSEQGAAKGGSQTGSKQSQNGGAQKGDRSMAQGQSKEPSKGTAQSHSKDMNKGNAQAEQKDRSKGAKSESKQSAPKSSAQGTEKGSAASKTAKDKGTPSKEKSASTPASGQRVQLSEQQRTSVHEAFSKDQHLNRVTKVNFTVNVGTHIPRSVHLAVVPAAVIAIVPQYRSYRYFVVNDDICIVDPNTYVIVDVVQVSSRTANRSDHAATLVLTDRERDILLREVDVRDGSTLALGSLTVGGDVPRSVELRSFPETVITQIPKLKGHKFFAAENRIAIVDPQGSKVQLVIQERR